MYRQDRRSFPTIEELAGRTYAFLYALKPPEGYEDIFKGWLIDGDVLLSLIRQVIHTTAAEIANAHAHLNGDKLVRAKLDRRVASFHTTSPETRQQLLRNANSLEEQARNYLDRGEQEALAREFRRGVIARLALAKQNGRWENFNIRKAEEVNTARAVKCVNIAFARFRHLLQLTEDENGIHVGFKGSLVELELKVLCESIEAMREAIEIRGYEPEADE